jgi:CelD/BcsL family acetyltransferase involved in cellulose biosynthesis
VPGFTLVDSDAGLQDLLPEWKALARSDPRATLFQRPEMVLMLREVFHPERRPAVAVMRSPGGTLQALLPLGRTRRRLGPLPLRTLSPLAGWHAASPDPLLSPESDDRALISLLASLHAVDEWDLLECRGIVAGGAFARAAKESGASVSHAGVTQSVRLAPGEPVMSAGHRRELRRLLRRLAETRVMVIGDIGNDRERRAAALQAFARLHQQRWERSTTPSPLADRAIRKRLVEWLAAPRDIDCRLICLDVDAEIVGVLIVFRDRGVDRAWRVAYDGRFSHVSPGLQLLTQGMELATAAGQSRFHLGRGEDPYKATWRTERSDILGVRWSRPSRRVRTLRSIGRSMGRPWVAAWESWRGGA